MDQLRHGNPWRGQFNVTARDGTPVVAFLVDTPVRSGLRVIGVVGVSRRERRRKSRGTATRLPVSDFNNWYYRTRNARRR